MSDGPARHASAGESDGSSTEDVRALKARLRDLRDARAELPPHSAQGWHADLDEQISRLQRRLAAAERDVE